MSPSNCLKLLYSFFHIYINFYIYAHRNVQDPLDNIANCPFESYLNISLKPPKGAVIKHSVSFDISIGQNRHSNNNNNNNNHSILLYTEIFLLIAANSSGRRHLFSNYWKISYCVCYQ